MRKYPEPGKDDKKDNTGVFEDEIGNEKPDGSADWVLVERKKKKDSKRLQDDNKHKINDMWKSNGFSIN